MSSDLCANIHGFMNVLMGVIFLVEFIHLFALFIK